jgi:serine-type D-Ala-D-Ala carboxypeptidase
VNDANAWAMGGVAGHAGLFGTAPAVGQFARALLRARFGLDAPDHGLAMPETVQRFWQRSRVPGSSRALAWDTMLGTSSCGSRLSPASVGHTGFTGTSIWIDPDRRLYLVLLTNRVHASALDGAAITALRRSFHDAVVESIEGAER